MERGVAGGILCSYDSFAAEKKRDSPRFRAVPSVWSVEEQLACERRCISTSDSRKYVCVRRLRNSVKEDQSKDDRLESSPVISIRDA